MRLGKAIGLLATAALMLSFPLGSPARGEVPVHPPGPVQGPVPGPRFSPGTTLRRMVAGALEAASASSPSEQSRLMWEALSEAPEVLEAFLAGHSLHDIVRDGILGDLLPLPATATTLLDQLRLPESVAREVALRLEQLRKLPPPEAKAEIQSYLKSRLDERVIPRLIDGINGAIGPVKFTRSRLMRQLLDPEKGLPIKGLSPAQTSLLQGLLSMSLDGSDLVDKRSSLHALLRLPANASRARQLGAVIGNLHPLVLAALETTAGKSPSADFGEILREARSQRDQVYEHLGKFIVNEGLDSAPMNSELGVRLRRFLAGAIDAASAQTPYEQSRRMWEALAEIPEVFEGLLSGQSVKQLLSSGGVDEFTSLPPAVAELFYKLRLPENRRQQLTEGLELLRSLPAPEAKAAMSRYLQAKVDQHLIPTLISSVNQLVGAVKFSQSKAVQQILDPEKGISMSRVSPKQLAELHQVLSGYFDEMDVVDKRPILSALLRLPPFAPSASKLSAVVSNLDPYMIKLFQLTAEDSKSELIRDAFREVRSRRKPFSGDYSRSKIEVALGQPIEQVFESFEPKAFARASSAQAHLLRMYPHEWQAHAANSAQPGEGAVIVAKVLEPGVREKSARAMARLKRLTMDKPFLRRMVQNLEEAVTPSLDLRNELPNIRKAKAYSGINISIAGNVEMLPTTEDVIFLHLAQGTNMDRETAETLVARGHALMKVLRNWFQRVQFGDGEFHADLQPGNIFRRKGILGRAFGLTRSNRSELIDFGDWDRLSRDQQRSCMKLLMAAMLKNPEDTVAALNELERFPEARRAKLVARYGAYYKEAPEDSNERFTDVSNIAMDNEVDLPRPIQQYAKVKKLLEDAIETVNNELKSSHLRGRLVQFDPRTVYQSVLIRELSKQGIGAAGRAMVRQLPDSVRKKLAGTAPGAVTSIPLDDWSRMLLANRDEVLKLLEPPDCFQTLMNSFASVKQGAASIFRPAHPEPELPVGVRYVTSYPKTPPPVKPD